MRKEILFRGKCVPDSKYAGEWVTGGYVAPDADCKKRNEGLIVEYFGGNTTITYHVDTDTVGQFTGLYDKNGKEIYEGDIIKIPTKHGDDVFWIGYETSHIGAFCLCEGDDCNSRFVSIFGRNYDYEPFYCEVIGNIHDNPELLSTK